MGCRFLVCVSLVSGGFKFLGIWNPSRGVRALGFRGLGPRASFVFQVLGLGV